MFRECDVAPLALVYSMHDSTEVATQKMILDRYPLWS
jgi:hypothetical protein